MIFENTLEVSLIQEVLENTSNFYIAYTNLNKGSNELEDICKHISKGVEDYLIAEGHTKASSSLRNDFNSDGYSDSFMIYLDGSEMVKEINTCVIPKVIHRFYENQGKSYPQASFLELEKSVTNYLKISVKYFDNGYEIRGINDAVVKVHENDVMELETVFDKMLDKFHESAISKYYSTFVQIRCGNIVSDDELYSEMVEIYFGLLSIEEELISGTMSKFILDSIREKLMNIIGDLNLNGVVEKEGLDTVLYDLHDYLATDLEDIPEVVSHISYLKELSGLNVLNEFLADNGFVNYKSCVRYGYEIV